jgi:GntR family transcriptional regulator / MocR family aminotransferase
MKKVPSGIVPVIAVDRKAPKALHRQIYDAYRTAIVERTLRSGQKVPSTRGLAAELGISRIPVLNAYAQLLAEGYFESRIGAGTVVSHSLPDQIKPHEPRSVRSVKVETGPRPVSARTAIVADLERVLPWLRREGAFAVGHPAFDYFPLHLWSGLIARHGRNAPPSSLHYGDPMGSKDLRETIATYLRTARAVRCEAQQIMIVSGSQQALEICTRVLLDPETPVWVEDPGYHFARDVFTVAGCKLIPVPVDSEGMDVAAGIADCRKARAAYITPSHQYPLGATMSASRRLQLLDWAESSGSWIIEDDYDSEYRYGTMPIASLQGLDRHSRVIYIGTFSKVLFPSLRLGYIVIPPDLVNRFLAIRLAMDLGPPVFYQTVLADFIRLGHFSRHLRRMRALYGERRDVLVEDLRNQLGSVLEIQGSEAGMHLAVTLRKQTPDSEIARRAERQGLWLVPLSRSYLGKASARQGFILGFGSTRAEDIPNAVRKLRNILLSK